MKLPYKDQNERGKIKRTYWPQVDIKEKRKEIARAINHECIVKGKKWSRSDKIKALNERWGEFCEKQREIGER